MNISATKYAVVVSFSFDPQVSVLLFDTPEDAMAFIKRDILEEYESDKTNGFNSEMVIYENEGKAILTTHWKDGDDVTEWIIGTVYNPDVVKEISYEEVSYSS